MLDKCEYGDDDQQELSIFTSTLSILNYLRLVYPNWNHNLDNSICKAWKALSLLYWIYLTMFIFIAREVLVTEKGYLCFILYSTWINCFWRIQLPNLPAKMIQIILKSRKQKERNTGEKQILMWKWISWSNGPWGQRVGNGKRGM